MTLRSHLKIQRCVLKSTNLIGSWNDFLVSHLVKNAPAGRATTSRLRPSHFRMHQVKELKLR